MWRMIEVPLAAVKKTDGGVGGGETDGKATSNTVFFFPFGLPDGGKTTIKTSISFASNQVWDL